MNQPLVSIIIVNYNGGDVFKECLNSLRNIRYKRTEIIIVDNGSADGTEKYATIKNKSNVGFAMANNQGLKKATGDYILLLNNDTKVEKNFLTNLTRRIMRDKTIGVVQPKIHTMSNPKILDSSGSFLTITGFLQHWGFLSVDGSEFSKEKFIFSAKGACMLIRKNVIDRVELFDSDYGSYLEETDFCFRVWLAGYKVLFYPGAKIFHKVGFTSKRQDQVVVNYHSFKNRIATLLKNLSFPNLILIGGLHTTILFCLIFYYTTSFQFEKSRMILKAIGWNLNNLKSLLTKRKFVQSVRVKGDKEIFKYIMVPLDFLSMIRHFIRSEKMLSGVHEV